MTVEEMLEQLPANTPDEEELQALFGRADMQHHLYGVHIPATDSYPEPEPAHWRCTCSACGQVFAVPDNRRLKDITVCPKCGATVNPHRWTLPRGGKRMAEQRAEKLQEERAFLQNQVQTLTEQAEQTPIQAEVVPSEVELEQVRKEVREEMQVALHAAEDRAAQAEARLEKAKNPTAMLVNLLFGDVQAQMDKLEAALAALSAEQPEVGAKFRTAVHQYFALHSQV